MNTIFKLFFDPISIIVLNIFFIIAAYTDIKSLKIYNKFNLIMLITRPVVLCIEFFIYPGVITWQYILNCLIGAVIMFLIFLIPSIITKDIIGGDIKFAFNIGLWTGIIPAIFISLIATVTNLIFRTIFVKNKDKELQTVQIKTLPVFFKAKNKMPLAPFFYFGYLCIVAYYIIVNIK